jgi:transposase-like protein
VTRFRFVSDYAEEYGVKRLCTVLAVSRSGYYDWRRRPESKHATRDAELGTLITEIHRRSRTTYGAPRVHAELRRLDQRCGRKRVARLMAAHGLVGAHARRKWRRGRPDVAPAPDLVNREFTASRPDEIWPPTSPSSGPQRAGSTLPASSTSTHDGSWDGRCRTRPMPIWSSTPSSWASNDADPTRSSSITPTG